MFITMVRNANSTMQDNPIEDFTMESDVIYLNLHLPLDTNTKFITHELKVKTYNNNIF